MKTTNFTIGQIKWASEHDWFVSGNENQITGQSDIVDCNRLTGNHSLTSKP